MKSLTIEIEDKLAKEIETGKKAIAVVDKEQIETMKDTESQVVGGLKADNFTVLQNSVMKKENVVSGLKAGNFTGLQSFIPFS